MRFYILLMCGVIFLSMNYVGAAGNRCQRISARLLNVSKELSVNKVVEAKESIIKYYFTKLKGLRYLNRQHVAAVILRFKLMFFGSGVTREFVPLGRLKPIHLFNKQKTSLEKLDRRIVSLADYFDEFGIPQKFTAKMLEQTVPSKNMIKAIKNHEGNYIIIDGNSRVVALRNALSGTGKDSTTQIEIEVVNIDYSKIKYWIELRRNPYHFTDYKNQEVRDHLAAVWMAHRRLKSEKKYLREQLRQIESGETELAGELKPIIISEIKNSIRSFEVITLWRERGFVDVYKQGITDIEIEWMVKKEVPLGFKNQFNWKLFKKELVEALRKDGISDWYSYIEGTATTFYSHNPYKKLGHHFDAKVFPKADLDIKVYSKELSGRVKSKGKVWKGRPHVMKSRWVNDECPNIKMLTKKWSKKLGRKLTVIGHSNDPDLDIDHGGFLIKNRDRSIDELPVAI